MLLRLLEADAARGGTEKRTALGLLEADAARARIVRALRQLHGLHGLRVRFEQWSVSDRCRDGRVVRQRQGNQTGRSKECVACERFHVFLSPVLTGEWTIQSLVCQLVGTTVCLAVTVNRFTGGT